MNHTQAVDPVLLYPACKTPGLAKQQLGPADLHPVITRLAARFTVDVVGHSFLGLPIHRISVGHGPIRILAWSQMHGDESTATASVLDLLNFIEHPANDDWRQDWQSQITLQLVPMLNPDGADQATRVNAQGIDINRDARCLQSPEGRILSRLVADFKPQFAFNLHDQNRHYSVGNHPTTATMSMLAPPADIDHSVTPARANAMRLIAQLAARLEQLLPRHIGRYTDSFSPRAFGDAIAASGAATVLIESGAYPGDDARQMARQMTFIALVAAIDSIRWGRFNGYDLADYRAIPENCDEGIADVVIRHLQMRSHQGTPYWVDVAVALDMERRTGQVDQLGDLAHLGSFFAFDAEGLTVADGKAYVLDPRQPLYLNDARYLALLRDGVSHFTGAAQALIIETRWPVTLNPAVHHGRRALIPGCSATWLMSHQGALRYAMLAGILIDLDCGEALNHFGT